MNLELNLYVEQPPRDHTNEGAEKGSPILQDWLCQVTDFNFFLDPDIRRKKKMVLWGEKSQDE